MLLTFYFIYDLAVLSWISHNSFWEHGQLCKYKDAHRDSKVNVLYPDLP